MNEFMVGWIGTLKLLLITAFAMCYWLGGRRAKWIRRWVGGLLFPMGVMAFAIAAQTFYWHSLLALALYPLALSQGYGADDRWSREVVRRAWYGAGLGAASWCFAFPGAFALGVTQLLLAIVANVWFGVTNPVEAAEEEGLIAFLSTICVPFMV